MTVNVYVPSAQLVSSMATTPSTNSPCLVKRARMDRKVRRWSTRKNTTTVYSVGGEAPTIVSPTAAAASQDSTGSWIQYASTTTPADSCWIYSEAVARRNWTPRVTFDVQFNGITNRLVWVGLFSALPTAYDPATGSVKCAALRFENPTDAENQLTFVLSNGTTTSRTLLSATDMPLDAFGTYRFTIDYDGTYWTFEYGNKVLATIAGATNGPAAATDLFWAAGSIINSGATSAKIKFGDVTLEHD